MSAPLCRCCGKPIAKVTVDHWFGSSGRDTRWSVNHPEKPTTRQEAQAVIGPDHIVSMRWSGGKSPTVWHASTWDGVSYKDNTFCTERCAAAFGRMCAEHTSITTAAYDAATAPGRA